LGGENILSAALTILNPDFLLENFPDGKLHRRLWRFLAFVENTFAKLLESFLPGYKDAIAQQKPHFCARAMVFNEVVLPTQNFPMEILG
jgi:hypothetical protein